MRTSKELLIASKEFAVENRFRSWLNLWETILALGASIAVTCLSLPWFVSLAASLLAALLIVRLFVIFHDYEHGAILGGSRFADLIMVVVGVLLLSPPAIWKRAHNDHHKNNARKFGPTVGTYPVVTVQQYAAMSWRQRLSYSVMRHPAIIAFGYVTIFLWEMSLKSFLQEPRRNILGLAAVLLHVGVIVSLAFLSPHVLLFAWLIPFITGMAFGCYLFYAQHNFPGMKLRHGEGWDLVQAALVSSSYMKMNRVMHWFTGNIGYHHVHHLNARIPFYRLPEAMGQIAELQTPACTTLHPREVYRCLRLKFWDPVRDRLVPCPSASSMTQIQN